jgi:hypothetical protein
LGFQGHAKQFESQTDPPNIRSQPRYEKWISSALFSTIMKGCSVLSIPIFFLAVFAAIVNAQFPSGSYM